MPSFSRLMLATALLLATGGHRALVQSAAWAGMLGRDLKGGMSLQEAFSRTFDGQHPCDLCKAVDRHAGDDTTKKAPGPPAPLKAPDLYAVHAPRIVFSAPVADVEVSHDDQPALRMRNVPPPLPPPKTAG